MVWGKADLEVEPHASLDGRTLRCPLFVVFGEFESTFGRPVLPLVSGRRVGPVGVGLIGSLVVGSLEVTRCVEGGVGPPSLTLVVDRVGGCGWAGGLIGAAFGAVGRHTAILPRWLFSISALCGSGFNVAKK